MRSAPGDGHWQACESADAQSRALRRAFGAYATGVAIVGVPGMTGSMAGMTVNSFVSVSLDPPLVSFAPSKRLTALEAYLGASHFAASVLGAEHEEQSSHFARPGSGKWESTNRILAPSGSPVLANALAAFDCRLVQRVEAGDHVIVIGEVLHYFHRTAGEPLLFWSGGYRRVAGDPAQRLPAEAEPYFLGWGA